MDSSGPKNPRFCSHNEAWRQYSKTHWVTLRCLPPPNKQSTVQLYLIFTCELLSRCLKAQWMRRRRLRRRSGSDTEVWWSWSANSGRTLGTQNYWFVTFITIQNVPLLDLLFLVVLILKYSPKYSCNKTQSMQWDYSKHPTLRHLSLRMTSGGRQGLMPLLSFPVTNENACPSSIQSRRRARSFSGAGLELP